MQRGGRLENERNLGLPVNVIMDRMIDWFRKKFRVPHKMDEFEICKCWSALNFYIRLGKVFTLSGKEHCSIKSQKNKMCNKDKDKI